MALPEASEGRLIIALDATTSREPTWDHASRIQGEMFEATAALGPRLSESRGVFDNIGKEGRS
jgi:hypothetical protein